MAPLTFHLDCRAALHSLPPLVAARCGEIRATVCDFIAIFGTAGCTTILTGASEDKVCYTSDLLRQTDHI